MKSLPSNWTLILHKGGQRVESYPLPEGTITLGREPSNHIPLPDTAISRQHAEILCAPDGVSIRDLHSRNGVLVNGVPRKKASLQAGDRIQICQFVLELTCAPPAATLTSPLHQTLAALVSVDQTVGQTILLPDSLPERQLATLYHVCFWVAEGMEEQTLAQRCLDLLRESFHAAEVHLYASDRQLKYAALDPDRKPAVKFAPFLAEKLQQKSEATSIFGKEIAKHQRGVGDFNYLIGPLRGNQPAEAACPFVVVLRPSDFRDFTAEDRVLLQAVCQLWFRGQARSNQLEELRQENTQLKEKLSTHFFLGNSAVLNKLREQARKAAATHATILLNGETGTGKEVLAQFIHQSSPRRKGPLVKMNCAAIPDSLIESELFGYAKGAFSGAHRDYSGKFFQANGGTLFLDEVGEMPLLVQSKVLRAIENREIQPLGSETSLQVDIRIIAATNRDLKALVRQGQFREDLYYRLDVQSFRVPPLREHPEDIDDLAPHFLKKFCADSGLVEITLAPAALAELKRHAWPGNIRELCNVIQRCALAAETTVITPQHIHENLQRCS